MIIVVSDSIFFLPSSCLLAFLSPDFLPPIHSHVLMLCILFLSSTKRQSDHEHCIQWYEEQINLRIFAYFI